MNRRFEEPTKGKILLDGVDVAHVAPHRRPVNTVFQSYALFPFMSVWDNVAFGLKYVDATKDEVAAGGEALALVEMEQRAKQKPLTLSAVSSSGWRWPGRWCSDRRCCCWTSAGRPGRQAPQEPADPAQGPAGRVGIRSSTSPTTRRRR